MTTITFDDIDAFLLFECFTFEDPILCEDTGWTVYQSNAYKKGMKPKKYGNNPKVVKGIKAIIDFIKSHEGAPGVRDYPHQYNVHMIKKDKMYANTMWAHLDGQKLGVIFSVDADKKGIYLINVGTHQDMGWK